MNRIASSLLVAALLAGALAAGYWLGSRPRADTARVAGAPPAPATAAGQSAAGRRILYYRNPMGLADTSPAPKKDPMGMDYVPVYEGEEPAGTDAQVRVSVEKMQRLGVKTEAAVVRELVRTLRAVGLLQPDERRLHVVAPRFEGWIERLHVNATGQPVARGQSLMEVYSPELVAAQQEYLVAVKGVEAVADATPEAQANMRRLVAGTLARLRNWDIAEEELRRLQEDGRVRRTLTLRSPVAGVVLQKPALAGMRFMPGEALFRIADLSSLWLIADVFEQDLALVRPGQSARITVSAYPGRAFTGEVSFVYPTLAPETRTAKVRVELANPGGLLKPEMYASVELATDASHAPVLAVPDSAVLDSGTRQVVLVERGAGQFDPRTVRLGARADGYVEVLEGVQAGDKVVVSANFLIDSESNFRAALGTFGPQSTPAAKAAGPGAVHRATGTVRAVDAKGGALEIAHGPVASLNWPAMTMEFHVTDRRLLDAAKPGETVEFDFIERAPGEFVVSRIAPAVAAGHKGH